MTIAITYLSFPKQNKMPFKGALKTVNRRDSWPPTILRLLEGDVSEEEIDANPFAYFLTAPTLEDSEDFDFFEDLSAGIEVENEAKTPVREVSPSSLQRTPLETGDDSHTSKGFTVPLSLRDFTFIHEKKKKDAVNRKGTELDHTPPTPPTPAIRGRGAVRMAPNKGRGQIRSRSLSAQGLHSWREPSPDVWSIPEEKEDVGPDDVPPLSLDMTEDEAQMSSTEEAVIFAEDAKKMPKKRVHWGVLPTRDS